MSAAISVPDGKVHLPLLSTTAITNFNRCAREFKYAYVLRRRPRRASEALRFGSFLHLALEAWWRAEGDAASKFTAAVEAMRARADESPEDADPFELVKAEELMLGYTARWGEEGYQTLHVEKTFEVPLLNPETGAPSRTYRLGGKFDVIAQRDGRRRLIEHKTTSEDIGAGTDYWRVVSALDAQVSIYDDAARKLYGVEDCLYDVVRKVALRPKKATPPEARRYTKKSLGLVLDARQRETDEGPEEFRERVRADIAENPEKYFARGPIVRLEHDHREHANDVWQTAWMIRESENSGRFPRSPNACRRYGRLCDYFDVCSGVARIDDESRFRTAEAAHEELREV